MVLNNSFTHLTPEDGCEVQQQKRSDIPSHQDEDKSPKIPLHKINIPSSKNLRKKLLRKEQRKYSKSITDQTDQSAKWQGILLSSIGYFLVPVLPFGLEPWKCA